MVLCIGFSMVIFLGGDDSIRSRYSSDSATVIIHDQSVMPFRETGIPVAANTEINIRIKKVSL